MVSSSSETEREDADEFEATEMHGRWEPPTIRQLGSVEPESAFGKAYCSIKRRLPRPLKDFWNHQISVTVSHDKCRDHFGMDGQSQHRFLFACHVCVRFP